MDNWDKHYELLKAYYKHIGDIKVPIDFVTSNGYEYDKNGYKLGFWLLTLDKNRLSKERINKLKNLGWFAGTKIDKFKSGKKGNSDNENSELKNDKVSYDNVRIKLKLLSLLERRIEAGILENNKELYNFLLKLSSDEVPFELSMYLYNYLYQKNDIRKISIEFKNNMLYIIEFVNANDFSYSIIKPSKQFGDIVKEKVTVKRLKRMHSIVKSLIYSSDAAIDLVVLNTNRNVYSGKNVGYVIEKEMASDDYTRIAFYRNGEYPIYDVFDNTSKSEPYEGFINNGIIEIGEVIDVKFNNLSSYSKEKLRSFSALRDIYNLEKYRELVDRYINDNENKDIKDDKNHNENLLMNEKEVLKFIKKMDVKIGGEEDRKDNSRRRF